MGSTPESANTHLVALLRNDSATTFGRTVPQPASVIRTIVATGAYGTSLYAAAVEKCRAAYVARLRAVGDRQRSGHRHQVVVAQKKSSHRLAHVGLRKPDGLPPPARTPHPHDLLRAAPGLSCHFSGRRVRGAAGPASRAAGCAATPQRSSLSMCGSSSAVGKVRSWENHPCRCS